MASGETPEVRRKRLTLRSWRRGMREMDLLLGPFAEAALPGMDGARLDLYEALLAENDQDLWAWVIGRTAAPQHYHALLAAITKAAEARGIPPPPR
jgi:antitoxin CptB